MYIPANTGGCPAGFGGVCRTWQGWKDTSWSSSCSEIGNSSLDSIASSSDWDGDLDLCAELLDLWAILGLCTW